MKEMSITEARLFLLESRIREEEKARIIFDQKLENGLAEIKKCNLEKSHHRATRSNLTQIDDKPAKFEKEKGIKIIKRRPNSSLGYREHGLTVKCGLRDKFSIKLPEY